MKAALRNGYQLVFLFQFSVSINNWTEMSIPLNFTD